MELIGMSDRKKPYSQNGRRMETGNTRSTGKSSAKDRTDNKKMDRSGVQNKSKKKGQSSIEIGKNSQTQMSSGENDGILDKKTNEKKNVPVLVIT